MGESDLQFPGTLLAADHKEMDQLFLRGVEALRERDPGKAHPALDRIWMRLAVHIRAEHKILFPALAESGAEVQAQVKDLRSDHDYFMAALAKTLSTLRDPALDIPSLQIEVEQIRRRLTAHNAIEESKIYPLVDLLPPNQRQNLLEGLIRELAFLPERYHRA